MDNSTAPSSVPPPPPGMPPPLDPAVFAALAVENRGHEAIAAAIACLACSFVFILLRFYTRIFIVRSVGASDWLSLVGWVFSAGTSAGMMYQTWAGGMGRHFLVVITEPATTTAAGKGLYFTTLLYICGLVSIKLSILFLYLRILNTPFIHRICYAAIGVIMFFGLYSLLTNIFTCWPIEKAWDPIGYAGKGWCFPIRKMWSDITCHLVGEFIILILPLPFVMKLKMPMKQKVAVCLLFALGIFVIMVGFLRIPSLKKIATSLDPSWDGVTSAVWSSVELNMAVICACCMTLRPLASRTFPRLISSSYQRESDDSGQKKTPPTVGSHRLRNDRQYRQSPASRTLGSMTEVPKIPPKLSYSNMSQSTAVQSDSPRSPTSLDKDDIEFGRVA